MTWKWTKRVSLGILCATLSGMLYQTISTELELKRYPPIGKMVNLGGYRLHLDCRGHGGPTVVLESGLGCNSLDWALVQPELSKFTRVCSYDRAGYGWSDESPNERTSENIVAELHALLHKSGIPGPYILVGHSFGGINVRLYASHYPDEVAGVVLVDSSHEDLFDRMPKMPPPNKTITLWMSRLGITRLLSQTAQYQTTLKKVFGKIPADIQQIRIVQSQATKVTRTILGEALAGQKSSSQLKSAGGLLGDKPLIVITAGITSNEAIGISVDDMDIFHRVHQELQKDLVTKSTSGRQIIAQNSDHMIPYHQPEIVIEAIRDLVAELNPSTPTSPK